MLCLYFIYTYLHKYIHTRNISTLSRILNEKMDKIQNEIEKFKEIISYSQHLLNFFSRFNDIGITVPFSIKTQPIDRSSFLKTISKLQI